MPRLPSLMLSAVSAALVACAASPAPAAEWRVLVKVASTGIDHAQIVQRASRASGVAVRYVAPVSTDWHGLALACGAEAACGEALRRLRADDQFFLAVERDEHRRPHVASSNAS